MSQVNSKSEGCYPMASDLFTTSLQKYRQLVVRTFGQREKSEQNKRARA